MAQLQFQTQIADSSWPSKEHCQGERSALLLMADAAERITFEQQVTVALTTYTLVEAATTAQALALWLTGQVDWAILDPAWAAGSGAAFLTALGEIYPQRPLPVVVLVETGQERAALEAMKLGAADYLFKADFTPEALSRASLALRQQASEVQRPRSTASDQARQHYQDLVEHSPDIIERFDRNLRHLYVSPALTAITGVSTADFLGKTCREIGLDDTMVNTWEAAAALVLATGEKQAIEFTTPTLSGVRHFEMAIAPEWSERGEIESLLCISRDISDRVAAQQAQQRRLVEAKRRIHEDQMQSLSLRLALALESAHIGTWERDMATDAVIWDQCLIDLYGFAKLGRQANYADWRAQVYTEDIQRVETAHQALVDYDTPYDLEFRIWRGDGTLGWIRSSALVRRNAQGHPLSVVGVNYDITDQKQAEAHLRDLSLRLDLALESGNIGTWQLELSTLQASWDHRMYAIYGFPDDGQVITFEACRNSVHSEDVERLDAAFRQAFEGISPQILEFRIRRGDGELRWVRGTALVQCDDQGQPLGMIGTTSDITEAKRAEELLLRTTAQLEASNRELEAFAYSVSHDLRAPLRAIDGFSRALIEDYGDQFGDEGRDYFDRIRHNVGRMGQLIDDLLRLSRVSRSAITYTSLNLSALVQEQIDELRHNEPDRSVAVAIATDLTVTADPTLMRVAIANLVQNAWKFTAHHPSARIEFGMVIQAGEKIYSLRDNGAGFDMAYADKLFGVFQRLHNTDEFPGTGIGLATVQRAIHRQGGRVWAEAALEQGATFYFTLPQVSPGPEGWPEGWPEGSP
ncbi:PAS domain-containing protein [Leptolyngbya sp. CCNP1308]|uniref:PAS domain-containing protein n=1 Tax=Leptolyngbya sp. CCNP1308 TaxID=3110255 RepID=UPI002B1F3EB0|nr:PAS domain-containing protein [Leptolyngbya sp. CCNP1308]MEA5449356.1 PAS domain-containing protein [Leptolyngbya sp. CCNP1308]